MTAHLQAEAGKQQCHECVRAVAGGMRARAARPSAPPALVFQLELPALLVVVEVVRPDFELHGQTVLAVLASAEDE